MVSNCSFVQNKSVIWLWRVFPMDRFIWKSLMSNGRRKSCCSYLFVIYFFFHLWFHNFILIAAKLLWKLLCFMISKMSLDGFCFNHKLACCSTFCKFEYFFSCVNSWILWMERCNTCLMRMAADTLMCSAGLLLYLAVIATLKLLRQLLSRPKSFNILPLYIWIMPLPILLKHWLQRCLVISRLLYHLMMCFYIPCFEISVWLSHI